MADALPSAAQNELASVIVEAWKTFGSRCRLGWPLEVCRCNVCVQPETEALLLNTPIREIPAKLLQAYTESAHASSSYADEQFRALLPRYFELMAVGDWPAHSAEVVLRRLVDAGWRHSWCSDEVALIDRFFSALFAHWLTVHEGKLAATEARSLLAMVAIAGGSVETLLAIWDADESLPATMRLADFIYCSSWGKRVQRLGAFWEDMPELERQVIDWLRRPQSKTRLADAFFLSLDPQQQDRLSCAELLI
jgi:hypothetical protein